MTRFENKYKLVKTIIKILHKIKLISESWLSSSLNNPVKPGSAASFT